MRDSRGRSCGVATTIGSMLSICSESTTAIGCSGTPWTGLGASWNTLMEHCGARWGTRRPVGGARSLRRGLHSGTLPRGSAVGDFTRRCREFPLGQVAVPSHLRGRQPRWLYSPLANSRPAVAILQQVTVRLTFRAGLTDQRVGRLPEFAAAFCQGGAMKSIGDDVCRGAITSHSRGSLLVRSAVGLALLAAAAGTHAQQAPATATAEVGGLQEIVVTAERRSENLQNVPIAVTAYTADALQSRGLTDIHALTALTPSVNLDAGAPFSGDRSVLSASIRGIGQDDFAFNLNPGVGVYLDGVFLARTIGSNQNLLDVDRVEILKGPQGTLFGANTIGGAISIVTHTPGNEPRFIATVTGGQYNRRDLSFTADLPIIKDVLLSSISVSSQHQDGWTSVIPYPTSSLYGSAPYVVDPQTVYPKAAYATSDKYDGTGVVTMRGKVLWNASDKTTVTFTGDWSHEDQTALGYHITNVYTGNMNYSTFSTLYNLCISNGAGTGPTGAGGVGDAIEAAGGPPPFVVGLGLAGALPAPIPNFAAGCFSPRARNVALGSSGGAPLIGAGYVGVPVGVIPFAGVDPRYNYNNIAAGLPYLGTNQPRIFDWLPATQTGSLDTSYASGPDFARNDVFGFSATAQYQATDDMSF